MVGRDATSVVERPTSNLFILLITFTLSHSSIYINNGLIQAPVEGLVSSYLFMFMRKKECEQIRRKKFNSCHSPSLHGSSLQCVRYVTTLSIHRVHKAKVFFSEHKAPQGFLYDAASVCFEEP